mgnify:CR=1 FL=1
MKSLFFIVVLFVALFVKAQDVTMLIADGLKCEQQLKDTQAIKKYIQALSIQPSNIKAAIKCAEMSCSIGARQVNENSKRKYYTDAKNYIDAALKLSPEDADANYITALVYDQLTGLENSTEKTAEYIKNTKMYADKALTINPNHGRAWHIIGKWYYEVLNLNSVKKAAIKLLYGGLPKATIEDAIAAFEKCKTLEPYFAVNYLEMARTYYYNNQYEKTLTALEQCIKCPSLSSNDRAIKEEAKQLLAKWQ